MFGDQLTDTVLDMKEIAQIRHGVLCRESISFRKEMVYDSGRSQSLVAEGIKKPRVIRLCG